MFKDVDLPLTLIVDLSLANVVQHHALAYTVAQCRAVIQHNSEQSEVSTRARESFSMASGHIFRVWSKFSFLLSSATQATSPCATESKVVGSLMMAMQGLKTPRLSWTVLTK